MGQSVVLGDSTDEAMWEKQHDNENYVEYKGRPIQILLDTNLKFKAIRVFDPDNVTNTNLYINDIIQLVGNNNGIKFVWEELDDEMFISGHHILRCEVNRGSVELSTWVKNGELKDITVESSLYEIWHEKYGDNNLKLSKITYTDLKQEGLSTRGSISNAKCMHYYNIKNIDLTVRSTGEKIVLNTKELMHYILLMNDRGCGDSDDFYRSIGFNYLELNLGYGAVEFRMEQHQLSKAQANENSPLYGLVLEQEIVDNTQIQKWKNKMIVLGYSVECTDTSLISIKEPDNKLRETITLPDFRCIEATAFRDSTIAKLRITSPDTLVVPNLPFISLYVGKNEHIEVSKAYSDKLDIDEKFSTILSRLYLHGKVDGAWSYLMSTTKVEYLLTLDVER